jgi:hypothetical protein
MGLREGDSCYPHNSARTARFCENLAFWRAGAGAGASSDPVDHIPACGCENPGFFSHDMLSVAFQAHSIEADPTDQALSCVACPRPRYNFEQAEITNPDER